METTQHQDELITKVHKYDILIKVSAIFIAVCILAIQVVLFFSNLAIQQQLTASVAQNAANGLANHKRTQAYIKCMAVYVTTPIDQRTQSTFDVCTNAADATTSINKTN